MAHLYAVDCQGSRDHLLAQDMLKKEDGDRIGGPMNSSVLLACSRVLDAYLAIFGAGKKKIGRRFRDYSLHPIRMGSVNSRIRGRRAQVPNSFRQVPGQILSSGCRLRD